MFNLERLIRPNIKVFKPYSSARNDYSGKAGVFLDANENPFGKLNRYPDPYQTELKDRLAQAKCIRTNNIFIGNGSDEIIDLAYRIFCIPAKDKVLTFSPTYGMYEVSAQINNIELIKIPLDKEFQLDISSIKPLLSDTDLKMIFICSPNNPTGNLMKLSDIEFILNNFNGIVMVDEAYIDFAPHHSLISLVEKNENLIICQTLSKAWGLAGARVGIAYANHKIIELYNKIKPPYNVSSINQQAAIEALDKKQIFKDQLSLILAEKENLIQKLKSIELIKKIYPSSTNFILVEVENATKIYDYLLSKKIITRNRHQLVKNCIRITIGTPEENNKLIKALKSVS